MTFFSTFFIWKDQNNIKWTIRMTANVTFLQIIESLNLSKHFHFKLNRFNSYWIVYFIMRQFQVPTVWIIVWWNRIDEPNEELNHTKHTNYKQLIKYTSTARKIHCWLICSCTLQTCTLLTLLIFEWFVILRCVRFVVTVHYEAAFWQDVSGSSSSSRSK